MKRVYSSLAVAAIVTSVAMVGLSSSTPATGAVRTVVPAVKLTWAHAVNDRGSLINTSSPVEATLDAGGPSLVVGDTGGHVWAFHLANGTAPEGWPVTTGNAITGPVEGPPSAVVLPATKDDSVFVPVGSDIHSVVPYGFFAFGPAGGAPRWKAQAVNVNPLPGDVHGVVGGIAIGDFDGPTPAMVAGGTGQSVEAFRAGSAQRLWTFCSLDSMHSTPAVADLYGNGASEIITGGESTSSHGLLLCGQTAAQGGHVRVLNGQGGQICQLLPQPNQDVVSSPAVGPFLAGNQMGIVTGTGYGWANASDSNKVLAMGGSCRLRWSATLAGTTGSSPALADVLGNGHPQVVEATDTSGTDYVYALNGTTGKILWRTATTGPIIAQASVATGDLSGQGYQDVVAPAGNGADIIDGKTGRVLEVIGRNLVGVQNTPLITRDPNGKVGITLAGFVPSCGCQGTIAHYEVTTAGATVGPANQSWPMFHHDAQLSGNL